MSSEAEVELEEVDGLDDESDDDVAPAGAARSVVSSVAISVTRLNTLVLRCRREDEGRGRCLWAESDAERVGSNGVAAAHAARRRRCSMPLFLLAGAILAAAGQQLDASASGIVGGETRSARQETRRRQGQALARLLVPTSYESEERK